MLYKRNCSMIRAEHDFDMPSLKLMRKKISNSYSLWNLENTALHVLFNIFLCDLFFITDDVDVASSADDNTPYKHRKSANKVLENLNMCIQKYI